MLSSTYSITDVKSKLNSYDYYNYANQTKFEEAIISAIDEAKWTYLVFRITESLYNIISAKDKTFDYEYERFIYKSEVEFATYVFLIEFSKKEQQSDLGVEDSLSIEGYSRSRKGESGVEVAGVYHFSKGCNYLKIAGYDIFNLGRLRKYERNEFV